jgi:hypothetical protein
VTQEDTFKVIYSDNEYLEKLKIRAKENYGFPLFDDEVWHKNSMYTEPDSVNKNTPKSEFANFWEYLIHTRQKDYSIQHAQSDEKNGGKKGSYLFL